MSSHELNIRCISVGPTSIYLIPEEELYGEPDDDHDLKVEEGIFDLHLILVVLDGGEHAQAQAQEDDHKAARMR